MRRSEWLLGAIAAMILLIGVGIAMLVWLDSQNQVVAPEPLPTAAAVAAVAEVTVPAAAVEPTLPPAPTIPSLGIDLPPNSAQAAFLLARSEARTWATDAQMINARRMWQQGATLAEIIAQPSAWIFTFYSPGQAAETIIQVQNETAARQQVDPILGRPTTINVGNWHIDDQAALAAMAMQDIDTFLANEGPSWMSLTLLPQGTEVEWQITLSSLTTGALISLRLDANTGRVIDIQQK